MASFPRNAPCNPPPPETYNHCAGIPQTCSQSARWHLLDGMIMAANNLFGGMAFHWTTASLLSLSSLAVAGTSVLTVCPGPPQGQNRAAPPVACTQPAPSSQPAARNVAAESAMRSLIQARIANLEQNRHKVARQLLDLKVLCTAQQPGDPDTAQQERSLWEQLHLLGRMLEHLGRQLQDLELHGLPYVLRNHPACTSAPSPASVDPRMPMMADRSGDPMPTYRNGHALPILTVPPKGPPHVRYRLAPSTAPAGR